MDSKSGVAILRAAASAPRSAADSIAALSASVGTREDAILAARHEREKIEADTAARIATLREERGAKREEQAERLRTEARTAEHRAREIKSKFSFVIGTVTEKTERR